MPVNIKRYGPGWRLFSSWVRHTRAADQCECAGECGKHHRWRCNEVHGRPAAFARGKIVLTTAHLCACDPPCHQPDHVRAMCQACHLRLDIALHLAHRKANRKAQSTQRPLAFDSSDPLALPTLCHIPKPSGPA